MNELDKEYQDALKRAREMANRVPFGSDATYNRLKEQIDQYYAQLQNQNLNERNAEDRQMILNRFNELSNPSSSYYRGINQQIRDNLTAIYNPNSLLALARGSGLSGQGSATIANQQRKQQQRQINEVANQGTNQAFTSAGGMLNNLLGMAQSGTGQQGQFYQNLQQLNLAYSQLAEQRRQFNESQPSFFDSLLNLGGYALGQYAGGGFGGGGAGQLRYGGGNSGYGYNQRPWTLGQNPYYGGGG